MAENAETETGEWKAEDYMSCSIGNGFWMTVDNGKLSFQLTLSSESVCQSIKMEGHEEEVKPRLPYAELRFQKPGHLDRLIEALEKNAFGDAFEASEKGIELPGSGGWRVDVLLMPEPRWLDEELAARAYQSNAKEIASTLLVGPEGKEAMAVAQREMHTWLRHASRFDARIEYNPLLVSDDPKEVYTEKEGEVGYGYRFGCLNASTHSGERQFRYSISLEADFSDEDEFEYPRVDAEHDDGVETWRADLHFLTLRLNYLEDLEAALQSLGSGELKFEPDKDPHSESATVVSPDGKAEPPHSFQIVVNERGQVPDEDDWLPIKPREVYYAEHLQLVRRHLGDDDTARALREIARSLEGWTLAVKTLGADLSPDASSLSA